MFLLWYLCLAFYWTVVCSAVCRYKAGVQRGDAGLAHGCVPHVHGMGADTDTLPSVSVVVEEGTYIGCPCCKNIKMKVTVVVFFYCWIFILYRYIRRIFVKASNHFFFFSSSSSPPLPLPPPPFFLRRESCVWRFIVRLIIWFFSITFIIYVKFGHKNTLIVLDEDVFIWRINTHPDLVWNFEHL